MGEERDMVKEYEGLRAKHKLPLLHDLDKEFCVGKLEESDFLLRVIAGKMSERIEHTMKILEDIIQPENHLSSMYEAEGFSDDDKKKAFELYKKLVAHHRELIIDDFSHEEDSAASLINKVFGDWKELKKEFLRILGKAKDSWQNEKKSKLELGYFG